MIKRFCNRCGKEIRPTWMNSERVQHRFEITVGKVEDREGGGAATDIIADRADLCESCWKSVDLVLKGTTP